MVDPDEGDSHRFVGLVRGTGGGGERVGGRATVRKAGDGIDSIPGRHALAECQQLVQACPLLKCSQYAVQQIGRPRRPGEVVGALVFQSRGGMLGGFVADHDHGR